MGSYWSRLRRYGVRVASTLLRVGRRSSSDGRSSEHDLQQGGREKDGGGTSSDRGHRTVRRIANVPAVRSSISQYSISVYCTHSPVELSVADATQVDFGRWWIARVNVHRKYRGAGYGSMLLNKLVREIECRGGVRIEVAPGGYGEDTDRQRRFYIKNGFIEDLEEGLLIKYLC